MASKRVRQKSVRRFQVTEERLLRQPGAREAFRKLIARGVDSRELLRLLSRIPFLSDKTVPLVDGMENRQVRKLPKQISDWARIIKLLTSSPFLEPDLVESLACSNHEQFPKPLNVVLDPTIAKSIAQEFRRLPMILGSYAEWLDAWLRFIVFPWRGFRHFPLRRTFTLQLLWTVRKSTGQPCYEEVATLLEAADTASGKPHPDACTADDLSKLERNNPLNVAYVRYKVTNVAEFSKPKT